MLSGRKKLLFSGKNNNVVENVVREMLMVIMFTLPLPERDRFETFGKPFLFGQFHQIGGGVGTGGKNENDRGGTIAFFKTIMLSKNNNCCPEKKK
jgi:hypothetical protein